MLITKMDCNIISREFTITNMYKFSTETQKYTPLSYDLWLKTVCHAFV